MRITGLCDCNQTLYGFLGSCSFLAYMTRNSKWIARARGKRNWSFWRGSVAARANLSACRADCGLSKGAIALLPNFVFFGRERWIYLASKNTSGRTGGGEHVSGHRIAVATSSSAIAEPTILFNCRSYVTRSLTFSRVVRTFCEKCFIFILAKNSI